LWLLFLTYQIYFSIKLLNQAGALDFGGFLPPIPGPPLDLTLSKSIFY